MTAALRAQTAQKSWILQEAAPSTTLAVVDLGSGEDAGLLRRAAASLGAGTLRGSTVQLFALATPRGTAHFYGQPFDGRVALPGEHHILLPFGISAPAFYVDGFTGGDWKSGDPALESQLRGHETASLVRRASWDWLVGAGKVKRDWLVQLRPTANGQTHLVMKATGEHGVKLDVRPVGFATLTKLVLSLVQAPPRTAPSPVATPFVWPSAFMDAFAAMQSGEPLPVLPRANLAGRDLGPAIHQLLAPYARGNLHVHPVPPKKEAGARTSVMPREAAHLPIVALVDLTLLGSASEAIVLTPSHVFVRHEDVRLHFEWSEVRDVAQTDPYDDEVRVHLAERGWLTLPAGGAAEALAALFAQVAQL